MSYNTPPHLSPAVSVIIPMYNVEKYVGECLDSLLAQTFTNFEVIVVDDCSTDSSYAIVESYIPKFNGRLILSSMEKNMGNGGIARNKGFFLSQGEYIQFVDSDDVLTKTALEELYTLAKDYDADVVYCEKNYMSKGVGEEFFKNVKLCNQYVQKPPFVDKPTFESEDLSVRAKKILYSQFGGTCWNKFIRRNLMLENELFFPHIKRSEDMIWSYGLMFYAKKILRVPNMVYIYRISEDSVMRLKKTQKQLINFDFNPILFGLKSLDNVMSKHEFFENQPYVRYAILKKFAKLHLNKGIKHSKAFSEDTVYKMIKDEFGEKLGMYDVVVPMLCAELSSNWKKATAIADSDISKITKFINDFIVRIDIKLVTKNSESNFEIVSVSDEKAKVTKPDWIQKNGIGYVIYSHIEKVQFIAKADAEGTVHLTLRGLDIKNPENGKRIPYWVDYTKLVVNGENIFDKLTPTWHDKPYRYKMNAKADEEITVEVEWLPHKNADEDLKT